MTSNLSTGDPFDSRRQAFEDAYFRTKDSELVARLKKVFRTPRTREELSRELGVTDPEVLDRLYAVHIDGEMLTAFKLYPLVAVAWADGVVHQREADAVIEAAVKHGIAREGRVMDALKDWLKRGPTPEGRLAWLSYAAELRRTLDPLQLATFREDLLKYARLVASTSGSILGTVAFEISPREQGVIDETAKALTK